MRIAQAPNVVGKAHIPKLVGTPEHVRAYAEIHYETRDGRSLRPTCVKPICPWHRDVREGGKLVAVEHRLAAESGDLIHARGVLETRLRRYGSGSSEAPRDPICAGGEVGRDCRDVRREDVASCVVGASPDTRLLDATRIP